MGTIQRSGPAILAALMLVFSGAGLAAKKWEFLGERVVNYTVDHDVIPVAAHEGAFRKIGLEVLGNDVRFRRIVIHFENGSKRAIEQNHLVKKGERTPSLNLPGNKRRIDRIGIWYDTVGFDGRATVRVYGMR